MLYLLEKQTPFLHVRGTNCLFVFSSLLFLLCLTSRFLFNAFSRFFRTVSSFLDFTLEGLCLFFSQLSRCFFFCSFTRLFFGLSSRFVCPKLSGFDFASQP